MRVSVRLLTGDLKSKKSRLCFFVFISNAEAAVYYVSAGGSDSDPGTESQPWNHCPGMPGWFARPQDAAWDIGAYGYTK